MKKILVLALATSMCLAVASKSFAATDNETYTVVIPTSTEVVLAAAGGVVNFGAITIGQFGTDAIADHNIVVGNGTVATGTSYVQSNSNLASGSQYTLSFAAGAGASDVSLLTHGTHADLTVANGTATSVDIKLQNNAKSGLPKLGAGTPVAFAVSGSTLDIAAASNVPFDAASGKAPLDMVMDLDESTVTMADTATAGMSFTMTLTAVAL